MGVPRKTDWFDIFNKVRAVETSEQRATVLVFNGPLIRCPKIKIWALKMSNIGNQGIKTASTFPWIRTRLSSEMVWEWPLADLGIKTEPRVWMLSKRALIHSSI